MAGASVLAELNLAELFFFVVKQVSFCIFFVGFLHSRRTHAAIKYGCVKQHCKPVWKVMKNSYQTPSVFLILFFFLTSSPVTWTKTQYFCQSWLEQNVMFADSSHVTSSLLSEGFWQLNLITSLGRDRMISSKCLAKTPTLRTKTWTRSLEGWEPRTANICPQRAYFITPNGTMHHHYGSLSFTG